MYPPSNTYYIFLYIKQGNVKTNLMIWGETRCIHLYESGDTPRFLGKTENPWNSAPGTWKL